MTIPVISRMPMPTEESAAFFKHVCPPTFAGDNPDPVEPTVRIARDLVVDFALALPEGDSVPMWIIEDPEDARLGRQFPSKLIRLREGDVVHAKVGAKKNTHTIHWHGIEPTPMNDGVGKHSFEVGASFVYQFCARQAGTYFYHCHKNTPLHFEMGLYGLLIVDPPEGQGVVTRLAPEQGHREHYDVEAFWVPDEIDRRWHELGHEAFMQKCDEADPVRRDDFSHGGILNDFRPDVFLVTGVPAARRDPKIVDPRVAVSAHAGQTILLRVLNAGYTVQRFTLDLDAEVIAMDGRPLGVPPYGVYSSPFTLPARTPFQLTSAMRWELLLKPTVPGTYPAQVEYFHWVTGKRLATVRTQIKVL
ncbi:MAG: multicopper oxidase domain-containing protein [Deltaproteobacteria bacterium]|nr:multicopper oxidase domain-containing protein [Deltaproteobacteria bacterium]